MIPTKLLLLFLSNYYLIIAKIIIKLLGVIHSCTRAHKKSLTSLWWKYVKRFMLKLNMRVRLFGNEMTQHFVHKLQQIGEGMFQIESNC